LLQRDHCSSPVKSTVSCRSCSMVHCHGDLSGRQRKNFVPWRKRLPLKWS